MRVDWKLKQGPRAPNEDDDGWTAGRTYAGNAGVAYAVRAWLPNDSQEAAWAARQLFDSADLAYL